ncbi:TPA: hypothetical protein ACH3X1_015345 [Trebouxia sp. C0004]
MLESILDTLQQSSLFNHCIQEQLRLTTPDLNRLCDCCLSCIKTSSHLPSLIDQLVDRKLPGVCADHAEALRLKQEGTASYRQAAYRQAAESYTDALTSLDRTSPSGTILATDILCNRALTFLRQTPPEAEAALLDASAALDCSKASSKAWYRRACSHEALHDYAAACSNAAMAAKLSRGAQYEDCIKLLQRLQAAQQQASSPACLIQLDCPACKDAKLQQPVRMPPRWSSEAASEAIPFPDTMLALKSSAEQGRQLVGAHDVVAGSVLWTEQPFAHLLLKQHRKQKCSMCLKPVQAHTSFSCPACPLVRYCSLSCCQRDPFHTAKGSECGMPWSLLLPADVVLATRMAVKLSQDTSSCAQHIQTLQTHLQQTSLPVLTELSLLATLAAICCRRQGRGTHPSAGSILKALLQIYINGLAVVPQQHTDATDRIALAVYPTASLMNHSCQPNVAVCFDGCKLTARAIESVQAGEPLLHCYGAQKGALITPLRRQQLQEQYHFVCGCRACQAGFDETEQAMVGLRCLDSRCSGVVVPKHAVPAGLCSIEPLPSCIGNGCCNRCRKCCNGDFADSSHSMWSDLGAARSEYASALAQLHSSNEVDVRTVTAATQGLLHVSEVGMPCC